jgi:hypothetical protein
MDTELRRVRARSALTEDENERELGNAEWKPGKHIAQEEEEAAAQNSGPDPILRHIVDIDERLKEPMEAIQALRGTLKSDERLNQWSRSRQEQDTATRQAPSSVFAVKADCTSMHTQNGSRKLLGQARLAAKPVIMREKQGIVRPTSAPMSRRTPAYM